MVLNVEVIVFWSVNSAWVGLYNKYCKHICIMKKTQHFGQNLLTIKIHLHTSSVWHAQNSKLFSIKWIILYKICTTNSTVLIFFLNMISTKKNRVIIFEMSLCNNVDQTRIILAVNMNIIVYSRWEYINICQTHS